MVRLLEPKVVTESSSASVCDPLALASSSRVPTVRPLEDRTVTFHVSLGIRSAAWGALFSSE